MRRNLYCIQANIVHRTTDTNGQTWNSSIQIPTFILNGDVQGIINEEGAKVVAKDVICPVPNPDIVEINITVVTMSAAEVSV